MESSEWTGLGSDIKRARDEWKAARRARRNRWKVRGRAERGRACLGASDLPAAGLGRCCFHGCAWGRPQGRGFSRAERGDCAASHGSARGS